jgi:hypothetical protein
MNCFALSGFGDFHALTQGVALGWFVFAPLVLLPPSAQKLHDTP